MSLRRSMKRQLRAEGGMPRNGKGSGRIPQHVLERMKNQAMGHARLPIKLPKVPVSLRIGEAEVLSEA